MFRSIASALVLCVLLPAFPRIRRPAAPNIQGVWAFVSETTTDYTIDPAQPGLVIFTAKYYSLIHIPSRTPRPELPETEKATAADFLATWGDQALEALDVTEVTFDLTDGNCLGFARERSIAINPVNSLAAQDAVS